jgi:hypothetical protein
MIDFASNMFIEDRSNSPLAQKFKYYEHNDNAYKS